MPAMNSSGFNLFTALVSFLLIILTVLLVQSMIQSERKASEMLGAIEARRDIEAIADNAAADAIQSFNYDLRLKVEDFASQPLSAGSNEFYYFDPDKKTWEQIKNDFVESHFSSNGKNEAFAFEIAQAMTKYFYNAWNFQTYAIDIENPAGDALQKSMQEVIDKSIQKKNFFEVVGCDGGNPWDCKLGTFYINLSLAELSDEKYEQLPRIVICSGAIQIENNRLKSCTGDEVKQPIMPRTNFRIYVPLRIFKAIAEARGLAHFSETLAQDIDTQILDKPEDIGLFGEKTSGGINGLHLGLCDAGICKPRENPCKAQTNPSLGKGCPGDPFVNPQEVKMSLGYDTCNFTSTLPSSYDAYFTGTIGGANKGNEVMKTIVKTKICETAIKANNAGYFGIAETELRYKDFSVLDGTATEGCKLVEKEVVQTDSKAKKKILYFGGNESDSGYCTKPEQWEATLAFKEENPNYLIEKGKPLTYRIKIFDSRFVPLIGTGTQAGETGNPGDSGWTCDSVSTTPQVLTGTPTPTECRPA